MKFKLGGGSSSSSSQDKAAGPPARSDSDKTSAGLVSASATSPSSSSATRTGPVRSMEEVSTSSPTATFATKTSHRLSVELPEPSPRNGRPRSLPKVDVGSDDGVSFAFQVPETPPRGSNLGKRFLEGKKFMLDSQSDAENGGGGAVVEPSSLGARKKDGAQPQQQQQPPLPFPMAEEDEGRHQICQDSLAPWTYLLQIPGKNVRDVLIEAFNDWLKVAPANLDVIKQIVGYLHTGSLIIDDIEDESMTRRGAPAAHVVFGVARALNADVYFLAMEKVLKLQSTECLEIFTSEMLNLHRGQGRDIFWRTTSYLASESEYRQMVCDKTGGLFRLAIRFLQALSPLVDSRLERLASEARLERQAASSGSFDDDTVSVSSTGTSRLRRMMSASVFTASSDFTQLADQMACYFQIRDDLINLASPKFHTKKGFCEDITEGKLSFIALHSLRSYRDKGKKKELDELLQILGSKTEDKVKIKRALTLMNDTGSFDYTVRYLKNLYSDIESSIASLGKNPKLSQLLKTISSEVDDCYDVKKRVIDAA